MKFLLLALFFCGFTQARGIPVSLSSLIREYTLEISAETTPPPYFLSRAEEGDAKIQLLLAGIYFKAHSEIPIADRMASTEELEKAYHWFKKSAEGGNKEAQTILGTIYCCANSWDFRIKNKGFFFKSPIVKMDWDKAYHWYEKAANQDHPEALYRLSNLHLLGLKVDRRMLYDNIYPDLQFLAKNGNKEAILALNLITLLLSSNPREVYSTELIGAANSIGKLAHEGYQEAQLALGTLYMLGKDNLISDSVLHYHRQYPTDLIPVNYSTASYWYVQAKDHPAAYWFLRIHKKIKSEEEERRRLEKKRSAISR